MDELNRMCDGCSDRTIYVAAKDNKRVFLCESHKVRSEVVLINRGWIILNIGAES